MQFRGYFIYSWFDIGISLKRPWISVLEVTWDEPTTNLKGVQVSMLDGWGVRLYTLVLVFGGVLWA